MAVSSSQVMAPVFSAGVAGADPARAADPPPTRRCAPVPAAMRCSPISIFRAAGERFAQPWSGPAVTGKAMVDVDPVGFTPSAVSASRWAVRSWASVGQRAYPMSMLAAGRL